MSAPEAGGGAGSGPGSRSGGDPGRGSGGGSGWRFAYHANCWGALGGDPVGVTSVGRLTYRTFGDIGQAARDIADVGYEGIELFDGNLLGQEEAVRASLDACRLSLVAVYSGGNLIFADMLEEELARIARAAEAGQVLGASFLVVGGGAQRLGGRRAGDMDALARALDEVDALARARGLRALYHPHLTTLVETPDQVRDIFARTAIGFCPDTAHLAAAGGDPAALVREHAERIGYVHLKGWQREPFAFTPVDEGECDNAAVLRALDEVGYRGWICCELDSWPDPRAGAERGLRFLRDFD